MSSKQDRINLLIITFARLWGLDESYSQYETEEERKKRELLSGTDAEDCFVLLSRWAGEYTDDKDICDFFEEKVAELVRKCEEAG